MDPYAIDVTADLIAVLQQSWVRDTQPDPYHVYLRLAYELSRDAREGLTLDIPPEVKQILLPHQISAVQVATTILARKGIAVIGDVVGLGKTLTGTAIAASVGESVLVIAPKNLTKMWEEHLHRFNIPGKVLSLSMVTRELPDLRRFRVVLIDESHNLRNRQRQAWDAINTYIDENDSKVVLLTATMYNARHRDIGGQLGLKLPLDAPLGVRPERLIADIGAVEVARRTGGRLDSLAAFERSEHNEDWQRLLSEFLVRRTRKFLETTYGTLDLPLLAVNEHRVLRGEGDGVSAVQPLKHLTEPTWVSLRPLRPQAPAGGEERPNLAFNEGVRLLGNPEAARLGTQEFAPEPTRCALTRRP